jgi:hypothetical protein
MPAGSRNVKRRAARKPKPIGAAETWVTPSLGASTNGRRKPSPRLNPCDYPPH